MHGVVCGEKDSKVYNMTRVYMQLFVSCEAATVPNHTHRYPPYICIPTRALASDPSAVYSGVSKNNSSHGQSNPARVVTSQSCCPIRYDGASVILGSRPWEASHQTLFFDDTARSHLQQYT